MSALKAGDCVRVVRSRHPYQDYMLGWCGIVDEVRYNKNMAFCGQAEEILVRFDNNKSRWIMMADRLEKIENYE